MHVGRAEWVTEDTYGNSFSESAWHSLDGSGIDQYSTLSTLGSSNDSDGDSLNNEQEAWWGTDPYSPDTDGDGYTDGGEVFYTNTNPASWDYFAPPAAPDSDGDGYDDSSDPANSDSSNYSSENATYWYSDALGDADGDGLSNFYDSSPWPATPNDDTDGDGLLNGVDPSPQDWMNYSSYNYTSWYGSALEDADGDGQANYYDWSPWDPPPSGGSGDPPPDQDADGIPDGSDPAPMDSSNISPINGTAWYGAAIDNSDGDSFSNFFDPAPTDAINYSSANAYWWYDAAMNDDDGDGQANYFDTTPFVPPPPDPPMDTDSDGDGLLNSEEATYGTDPNLVDSDSDGLTDYEELRTFNTNPLDNYSIYNSSPSTSPHYKDYYLVNLSDLDAGQGDGIPDRIETFYGLNPNDPSDAYGDLDADGVSNFSQYQAGIPLDANLVRFDADQDGMTTVFEQYFQLNDGVFGDSVDDPDNDGVFNFEEAALALNPRTATSRVIGGQAVDDWSIFSASSLLRPGDTSARVFWGDWDADGLPDAWEHRYGLESNPTGGMKIRTSDSNADYDGDGVTNAQEFALGFNPLIQETHVGILDSNYDRDGDGLADVFELQHNLDFDNGAGDADGDGADDAREIGDGTDPHDQYSNTILPTGPDPWTYHPFPISGSGDGPVTAEDTDGDGLLDTYEDTFFGGKSYRNGRHDADEDGVLDSDEATSQENYAPLLWDKDGDGRRDVIPVTALGTGALILTNDNRGGTKYTR